MIKRFTRSRAAFRAAILARAALPAAALLAAAALPSSARAQDTSTAAPSAQATPGQLDPGAGAEEPKPENALAVHGLVGVDFPTEYISRGLVLEDQGFIAQPYAELDFTLFEAKEASISKGTFFFGIWNSLQSQHTDAGLFRQRVRQGFHTHTVGVYRHQHRGRCDAVLRSVVARRWFAYRARDFRAPDRWRHSV